MSGLRACLLAGVGWAWVPVAAMAATPEPIPYRAVRPQLLEALGQCRTPTDLLACDTASQRLEQLIAIAERPGQREQRPRCLGALGQLQSHLTVFRWGYESREQLQHQLEQAMLDCPPAPPTAPPVSRPAASPP